MLNLTSFIFFTFSEFWSCQITIIKNGGSPLHWRGPCSGSPFVLARSLHWLCIGALFALQSRAKARATRQCQGRARSHSKGHTNAKGTPMQHKGQLKLWSRKLKELCQYIRRWMEGLKEWRKENRHCPKIFSEGKEHHNKRRSQRSKSAP